VAPFPREGVLFPGTSITTFQKPFFLLGGFLLLGCCLGKRLISKKEKGRKMTLFFPHNPPQERAVELGGWEGGGRKGKTPASSREKRKRRR